MSIMSSDDKKTNNNGNSDKKEESFSTPEVNLSSFKDGVHQAVKTTVSSINSALQQLQHTSQVISKPVKTGIEHLEHTTTEIATEARIAYERRHEFGPYYVAGAFIGVGGITALRRGRFPGLVLGSLAGGAMYMALYQPITDAPSQNASLPKMSVPTIEDVKSKLGLDSLFGGKKND